MMWLKPNGKTELSQLYQCGDVMQCAKKTRNKYAFAIGIEPPKICTAAPKVQEEEKPGAVGDLGLRQNFAPELSGYALKLKPGGKPMVFGVPWMLLDALGNPKLKIFNVFTEHP